MASDYESSMIETVARAIADCDFGPPWELESPSGRDYYRRTARAAIAAMRSPIVRQLRAAGCTAPLAELTESAEFKIWQAMIDEALGTPQEQVSR